MRLGGSVPGAFGAVPVDVARHPLGADARHQPLDLLRSARGAGRTRLFRRREVFLEALAARFAPVLVDRHRSQSRSPVSTPDLPDLELLRSLCERQGVSPDDDDLAAVQGFLQVILPALEDLERRLADEPGLTP